MTNLPVKPADLLGSIQKTIAAHASEDPGGVAFLKMGKSGIWTYGADEMEVEDESLWAVHPASFKTGYIAWERGNTAEGPVGEEMVSITEDSILLSDLPKLNGGSWAQQVGFQAACINGDDEGTQVVYKSSSKGGRSAFNDLLQQLLIHYKANPGTDKLVPIVALEEESYKHKEYGKIYKPIFTIVEWGTLEGQVEEPEPEPKKIAPKEKAEEEPKKPAPRKRRRRAA